MTATDAAAMQLDPGVAGDPSLIAAAGVALPGDNGTARAIAALRTTRVLNGGTATLSDGWGDIVYQVGSDSQGAATARDTNQTITGSAA